MNSASVLYVYYEVDATEHATLAPRVRQVQKQLSVQWPGLICELLQRPEADKGIETWMETYRHSDGITAALTQAITDAAATAGLPASRHTESFIPLL